MVTTYSEGQAILYDKYRLPYAVQAVDDLIQRTGEVHGVADVGAGTGQLARMFTGKCDRVYVVEPDPAMRNVAATSLADFKMIEIRAGYAEQTTLAENSINLIVIGNAFYRFKP